MVDIATLGIAFDSSGLEKGNQALDATEAKTRAAGDAAGSLEQSLAGLTTAVTGLTASQQAQTQVLAALGQGHTATAAAAKAHADATTALNTQLGQTAGNAGSASAAIGELRQGFNAVGGSAGSFGSSISLLNAGLLTLGAAAATYGVIQIGKSLKEAADNARSFEDEQKKLTALFGDTTGEKVYAAIDASAKKLNADSGDLTNTVQALALGFEKLGATGGIKQVFAPGVIADGTLGLAQLNQGMQNLGSSIKVVSAPSADASANMLKLNSAVELLNTSVRNSIQTDSDATDAITAVDKALVSAGNSGQFTAQMFDKILNASPAAAQAIASTFNVSVGQMRASLSSAAIPLGTFVQHLLQIKPAAKEAMDGIAGTFDALNKAWSDLKTGNIIKAIDDVQLAWKNFLGWLNDESKGGNPITTWFTNAWNDVQKLVPSLTGIYATASAAFKNFIASMSSYGVSPAIASMINQIRNADWAGAWASAQAATVGFFNWIGDQVSALDPSIARLVAAIKAGDWAGAWQAAQDATDEFIAWTGRKVAPYSAVIGEMLDQISMHNWDGAWNTAKEAYTKFSNWLDQQGAKDGKTLSDHYDEGIRQIADNIERLIFGSNAGDMGKSNAAAETNPIGEAILKMNPFTAAAEEGRQANIDEAMRFTPPAELTPPVDAAMGGALSATSAQINTGLTDLSGFVTQSAAAMKDSLPSVQGIKDKFSTIESSIAPDAMQKSLELIDGVLQQLPTDATAIKDKLSEDAQALSSGAIAGAMPVIDNAVSSASEYAKTFSDKLSTDAQALSSGAIASAMPVIDNAVSGASEYGKQASSSISEIARAVASSQIVTDMPKIGDSVESAVAYGRTFTEQLSEDAQAVGSNVISQGFSQINASVNNAVASAAALASNMQSAAAAAAASASSAASGGGGGGGGGAPAPTPPADIPPVPTDIIPGFATGGTFGVEGSGGTDSQLVQFHATPGEVVTIHRPGEAPTMEGAAAAAGRSAAADYFGAPMWGGAAGGWPGRWPGAQSDAPDGAPSSAPASVLSRPDAPVQATGGLPSTFAPPEAPAFPSLVGAGASFGGGTASGFASMMGGAPATFGAAGSGGAFDAGHFATGGSFTVPTSLTQFLATLDPATQTAIQTALDNGDLSVNTLTAALASGPSALTSLVAQVTAMQATRTAQLQAAAPPATTAATATSAAAAAVAAAAKPAKPGPIPVATGAGGGIGSLSKANDAVAKAQGKADAAAWDAYNKANAEKPNNPYPVGSLNHDRFNAGLKPLPSGQSPTSATTDWKARVGSNPFDPKTGETITKDSPFFQEQKDAGLVPDISGFGSGTGADAIDFLRGTLSGLSTPEGGYGDLTGSFDAMQPFATAGMSDTMPPGFFASPSGTEDAESFVYSPSGVSSMFGAPTTTYGGAPLDYPPVGAIEAAPLAAPTEYYPPSTYVTPPTEYYLPPTPEYPGYVAPPSDTVDYSTPTPAPSPSYNYNTPPDYNYNKSDPGYAAPTDYTVEPTAQGGDFDVPGGVGGGDTVRANMTFTPGEHVSVTPRGGSPTQEEAPDRRPIVINIQGARDMQSFRNSSAQLMAQATRVMALASRHQ